MAAAIRAGGLIEGLVSTIVPVYNRPDGLREAVDSVLAQDYRPIEIIVVDDGSTDATPGVASDIAREHAGLVTVIRQRNAGPGVAREAGREAARGEFLQYLDSDDLLLPGKFRRQVDSLRADPDAHISYGWVRLRNADGTASETPWKRTGERHSHLFPSILVERWWETSTPVYRSAFCAAAGPWLPLWNEEDWEYDCRLGALGARLAHVEAFVCEHRHHSGSRLSDLGSQAKGLASRAIAHTAMFEHTLRTGLALTSPECALFARRLFLLARQCGAAGLESESARLFDLARRASTPKGRRGLDFKVYAAFAAVLGWTVAGRAAQWTDRVRRR